MDEQSDGNQYGEPLTFRFDADAADRLRTLAAELGFANPMDCMQHGIDTLLVQQMAKRQNCTIEVLDSDRSTVYMLDVPDPDVPPLKSNVQIPSGEDLLRSLLNIPLDRDDRSPST